MLNSNRVFLGCIVVSLLISCAPSSRLFSEHANMDERFYGMLTNFVKERGLDLPIRNIEIYKAVFTERFMENENVVEYTLLNTESSKAFVRYQDVFGFTQHLYLFRMITDDLQQQPFIYFSVKYKADLKGSPGETVSIGFGPAYYGTYTARGNTIRMEEELMPRRQNDSTYYFKSIDEKTNMLFNVAFTAGDAGGRTFLDIIKIVQFKANKIGGDKSLVYNISDVFNDPKALRFALHKTIPVNN